MQRLVRDLILRKRYILLAFIFLCVGYAIFHASDDPSVNQYWLWIYILPNYLNFELKPSSRSVDVYGTLPLSRRTYMRSRWVVAVALPVVTASAIILTAILAGGTLSLREFVLVVAILMTVAGMSSMAAGVRMVKPSAGQRLKRLVPFMVIWPLPFLFCFVIPARHFVLDSTPILTVLFLGGLVSVVRSFLHCNSSCDDRSFQVAASAARKPEGIPRFIPKWRGPLIFVETSGWATAWMLMGCVAFMAAVGEGTEPVPVAGVCLTLWPPLLFLGRISNSSMRFMRTLPISRARRLALLWSPPTVIGVLFCLLGALVITLSGNGELVLRSSAAVCLIGWCWIWFAVFARYFERLQEMNLVRGILSVFLLAGLTSAYALTLFTVFIARDTQTNDFLRGVGGLVLLACVFVFCEAIADLGGRRRWTPRACTSEAPPEFLAFFVDPSRSVKRWTAACLLVMIALSPFILKNGLLKLLVDRSKNSVSVTQRD